MKDRIERDTAEVMRDEMVMKDKILSLLGKDARTVPEVAAALECSTDDVMLWIMAMWRYGSLEEVSKPNDEGYYKYQPVV
ncbi:MAG: MarR family transcriptional regulator [Candidatus Zixiibacteriota bacterium]|nr:MAG: MarR family transcriptional regulator [candidate division Zixibacteria bacterium]